MSIRKGLGHTIAIGFLAFLSPVASAQPVILGVGTLPMSEPLQQHLGSQGRGVLVDQVVAGSKAEGAGIASGDVLVAVNDHSIHTPQQLSDLLRTLMGQTIEVHLVRDQKQMTTTVILEDLSLIHI